MTAMAYIVMAYVVMAYIPMAHAVMAYIVTAYMGMAIQPWPSLLLTTMRYSSGYGGRNFLLNANDST